MPDFFRNLLSADGFVARRACGTWSAGHIWLHTASDLLIWLAYLSIPLVLGFFLWRRRAGLPFRGLIALFAAFILLCGFTHLLDALMFDWPAYRLSGLLKAVTAVVSWLTVVALIPAVPRVLAVLDRLSGMSEPPADPTAGGADRPQRYVVAAGLAGLALLLRFAVDPLLHDGRGLVVPLLAVMAAAWYGGFGPGVLALLLAGGGYLSLFADPGTEADGLAPQTDLAFFVFGGVVASALGQAQRAARLAAAAATADLHESNRQLARSQWDTAEALTQLDAFLQHAPVGLAFLDPDLQLLRANNYLTASAGGPPAAGSGRTPVAGLPVLPADVRADLRTVLDTGRPLRDRVVAGATGPDSVWQVSAFPAHDPHGVGVGLAVVAQDVSDRVRQERAVQASEARFRTLVEALPGYVWTATPDGAIDYQSPTEQQYTGLPSDDMYGERWLKVLHPDDVPGTAERWKQSLATGEPYRHAFRLRRHDGAFRWFDVQGVAQRDAGGTVTKWVGYAADVHEQKETADALAASQERFRATADAAPAVLWETDPDGQCRFLSRGWYALTGQPDGEGLGQGWLAMTHPDDLEAAGAAFHAANAARTAFRVDYRVRRADGEYRWAVDEGRPRFGPAGEYLGMVGSVIDVDDRRRAEDDARAAGDRLRQIIDTVPAFIALADPGGRYKLVNRAYERLYGLPREAIVGRHIRELVGEAAWATTGPMFDRAAAGEVVSFENDLPGADGGRRTLAASFTPKRGPAGETRGVVISALDVSDRKQAEAAVRASEERLRLAAQVAGLAVAEVDYRADVVHLSAEAAGLLGWPADPRAETRTAVHALFHPADREAVDEHLARSLDPAGGGVFALEHRVVRPDGRERWVSVRKQVSFAGDKPARALVVLADVTARKEAEQAVRASEAKYRTLFETMDQGYCVIELLPGPAGRPAGDYRYLEANPAFERHSGLAGAVGRTIRELAPGIESHWPAVFAQVAGTGEPVRLEEHSPALGRWFDVYAARQGGPDSRRVAVLFTDTTARKRAELDLQRANDELEGRVAARTAELRREKAFLGAVLESVEDAIVACDEHGALTLFNRATKRLHGLPPEPVPADRWADHYSLFGPDGRTPLSRDEVPLFRALAGEDVRDAEMVVAPHGADPRTLLASGRGLFDEDGRRLGAVVSMHDVTDRRAAEAARAELAQEQARRREEERFRQLADAMPQIVYVNSADGDNTFLNRRWYEYTGLATDDPQAVADVIHPDDRAAVRAAAAAAEAGGGELSAELRLRRHDGQYRWFLTRSVPVRDAAGAVAHRYGTSTDIDDQKRAEHALRDAQGRLDAALEAGTIGTWNWAVPADRVTGDRNLAALFGLPADAVAAGLPIDRFLAAMHPDDRDAAAAALGRAVAAGDRYEAGYRLVGPDGAVRWAEARGRVVRDAAGRPVALPGVVADVSARKAAEQALRASEERFEFVRRSSGVGFWYCDLPFDALEWDEQVKAHFHLPPDAPVTIHTFYDRMHPADREPTRRAIDRSIADHAPYDTAFRTVHPATGAEKWVRAIGRTGYAADGTPRQFDGVTLDVTDQRRAEERLRLMVESIHDYAIFTTDPGGLVTSWHPGAERVFGYPEAEIVGQPAAVLFTPEDRAAGVPAQELAQAAATGRGSDVRWHLRRDGSRFFASGAVTPIGPGGSGGFTKVCQDITARRTVEDALQESQDRLELAVGIAGMGTFEIDLRTDAVEVNEPGRLIYGWDAPRTTFTRVQGHFHPDDRPDVLRAVAAAFDPAGPGSFEVEQRIHRTDGAERWLRVRGQAFFSGDGADRTAVRCVGTFLDVTDQKRAEQELADGARRYAGLLAAQAEVAAAAADRPAVLAAVARLIPPVLRADGGMVEVVHGDRLVYEAAAGAAGPFVGLTSPVAGSLSGLCTLEDRPLVCTDAEADDRVDRDACRRVGVRAMVVAPLRHRGRVVGVLKAVAGRPGAFTDRDAVTLQLLAGVAAGGLSGAAEVRAEEALRESEANARLALEVARLGTWRLFPDAGRAEADARTREVVGLPPAGDLLVADFAARAHPDDWPRVEAALRAATDPAGTGEFAVEHRYVRPDGTARWVAGRGQAEFAGDGPARRAVLVRGTVQDVTARKRAEDRQRLLADLAAETQALADPQAVTAAAARLLVDRLGADRCAYADVDPDAGTFAVTGDHCRGLPTLVGTHPLADFGPAFARDGAAGRPFVLADREADDRLAEADRRAFRRAGIGAVVCVPLVKGGRFVATLAVHQAGPRDWTPDEVELVRQVADRCWEAAERARVGQELAASEARFRGLADTAPQIIWEARPDGTVVYLSRFFEDYTGRPAADGLGDGWEASIRPDQTARLRANWGDAVRGADRFEDLFPLRRKDGAFRWFLSRARLVRKPDGTPDRWVGTNTDVHDRVEAEEALAATQRTLTLSLATANAGVYTWDVAADRATVRQPDPRHPGVLATTPAQTYEQRLSTVHPDDRDLVRAGIDACRASRRPFALQFRVGTRDQGWRWVESRGQFEYAPDGTALRLVGVRLDIHDRKTAEEAARKADREFRAIADNIPALAWMARPDGHIDWYNSRWYEYTGTTFEQMQGWGWQAVHDPAELARFLPDWQAALRDGTPFESTFPLRAADGSFGWFLTRARPIRDDAGNVVRWFGTNTDVTARRRLEADLRASEARLQFLDALGQATREADARATLVVTCGRLGGHLRATRCAYAEVAADGDGFSIRHDWTDGAPSTVGDYSLALFGGRAAADMRAGRPLVVRDVDAELGPHGGADAFTAIGIKAVVCCPLVRGGRLAAMMAVHHACPRDWTVAEVALVTEVVERSWAHLERGRAEAAAREAGERFRTLTEAIPQMVFNADAGGRVTYFNSRWQEYTGLAEADALDRWWPQVVHPADAPALQASWRRAMRDGTQAFRHEVRVRRQSDGAYRWFLTGVVPLRAADGGVDQWIGSLSDVHDLKTAEEATRAGEARFRNLVEAVPSLVWVTDAAGRITQVNRHWVAYTGRPLDDLLGDGWTQLLHPDDAAGAVEGWQAAVRRRTPYVGEFRLRTAAGAYRWQLSRGTPVAGPDGRLSQWFGTTTDIDDQRRASDLLEAQVKERTAELKRSNDELDKFAYVASHDLQEPLRKVQAFGDRLAKRFAPDLGPDGQDYVERMQASAARMQTLINDLLAFARVTSRPRQFVPVPLGPLVAGVLSDLEALTGRTGAVVRVGVLPTVSGDPGQLRQVFQNLLANACKFRHPDRPPGVEVLAERLDALPPDADPPAGLPAGWRVTVSDDGIGFEQQYAEKIFEVFQRLHGRAQYEGTGIGLAICRKIVERHGGIISARGRPGEGAVFAVDFPAPPSEDPGP